MVGVMRPDEQSYANYAEHYFENRLPLLTFVVICVSGLSLSVSGIIWAVSRLRGPTIFVS